MSFLSRLASTYSIGLDIQDKEIRLLQLCKMRRELVISNMASVLLPPDVIEEGKIKNRSVILSSLKELVKQTDSENKAVSIALPGCSVINKLIKLHNTFNDEECELEIASKINQYFPSIKEKLCFDFFNLYANDPGFHHILLVAAREDQLLHYMDVVREAGLKITAVDVDAFALMKLIKWVDSCVNLQETMVILLITEIENQLIFVKNQEIILHHLFFTKDITYQLKHTWQLITTQKNIELKKMIVLSSCEDVHRFFPSDDWQSILIIHMNPFKKISIKNFPSQKVASNMILCLSLALRGYFDEKY